MSKEKEIKNNTQWQKIKAENPERYQELLEYHRQYHKERLQWLDENGYCHRCGKNKMFGNAKFCAECLEYDQNKCAEYAKRKHRDPEYMRNYQIRRREIYRYKKENGICVRCSKPATHGLYCYEHSIERKRSSQKRAQIKKNERHDRGLIPEYRKINNLCCFCGNPVEEPRKHGRACNKCAIKFTEYSYRQDKSYWKGLQNIVFMKRQGEPISNNNYLQVQHDKGMKSNG